MIRTEKISVEIENGGSRELDLPPGSHTLADLLAANDLPLNTRCGQRGLCKGCELELQQGTVNLKKGTIAAPATIRACQSMPAGDLSLFIPNRSRIEHKPQVGETFEIAVPYAHQPLFAPEPGRRDTGFAVDIGTTTVVVLLVDLTTGETLSRAGGFNEQIRHGDNVVTRIDMSRSPAAIATLQNAVVKDTLVPLLLRACERAGRGPERIAGGTISGNTTMLHLLTGEDPSSLGVAPFTPRFISGRQLTTGCIGFVTPGLDPAVPIQLLPGISAYIGADIMAGIYATSMVYETGPCLLVDIGTNGEIVLNNSGRLTACATAAGPAFEGSGLRCGTRAREGAISDLTMSLDPFRLEVKTIGGIPLPRATGICGSAYVDFLARARGCGLLSETGRFDNCAWEKIPETHRFPVENERAVRMDNASGAGDWCISEVDVALLLQAKAAIGAGIETLLQTAQISAEKIMQVYLAGGFGMHLDISHAIAIGLLPGFREEQVRVVGNASLAGALLALVDRNTLVEMEMLRTRVEVIELNLADDFEDRYIEHLMLP